MSSPYSTNVPDVQFTATGVVVPAEDAILAGVQADVNSAFGGGVNPALNTPQGQIASSETAIIADKNSSILFITNNVDPQYASGRWQDAIGRINVIADRKGANGTMVTANLTGITGTFVPAGTQAKDTSGNYYVLLAQVTIDSTGTTQGVFQNIVQGPIACPDNTLNIVYQAVSGWDSVNNPPLAGPLPSAVLGNYEETRAEFEYRRQNSLAVNGSGSLPSIYGNTFNVPGVIDCYAIENPSSLTVNYGSTNYPLAPHSVYVATIGGNPAAVAYAIWYKKNPGCDYSAYPVGLIPVPGNGTVITETVTDPSGYSYPLPSYQVSYITPGALPIYFAINIFNNPSLPSNIIALVQAAVIARFNGTDGTTLERIGALVLATRYYTAIAGVAANVLIQSVLIGITSSPSALSVQCGIDQGPTINVANIAVTLV